MSVREVRYSLKSGGSKDVARPERFELPTPGFVGRCSIQLSYGRVMTGVMAEKLLSSI
jgi:hypothetical protein